jgi:hypothetical protein
LRRNGATVETNPRPFAIDPVRKNRPLIRRWLTRPLLFCAAVLLLIEEWLWRGAAEFVRELSRLPPVERCTDWIRRRTPYQALALFMLPILSLLPLKGVIVLAFLHGRALLGITVLVLQKLIFSVVFASLYQLTAPAITQIGWVLRAQQAFLRVRGMLHAWLERQAAYRQARAWLWRIRRNHWLRRRFGAAYRMQRRRTSRFCFCH